MFLGVLSYWESASPTGPVVPGVGATYCGGSDYSYLPRPRTRDELRRDRERFGISNDCVPVKVCKVIARVAKRKVENPELALDAAFHRELERKALAYRAYYAEVLRQQIEELQRIEDEEIALVLLMH